MGFVVSRPRVQTLSRPDGSFDASVEEHHRRIYWELRALLESAPDFLNDWDSQETMMWLGRVEATLKDLGLNGPGIAFSTTARMLHTNLTRPRVRELFHIIYVGLAFAERKAGIPAGIFVPAGDSYDAFEAVRHVLGTATENILVVDPAVDANILNYIPLVPAGVPARLLADPFYDRLDLKPAVEGWLQQYGEQRPLEARFSSPRQLHDRMVIVDQREVWRFSQSFSALAKRSPATVQQLDASQASEKLAFYENVWSNAQPLGWQSPKPQLELWASS